jgi:hypothetical protein
VIEKRAHPARNLSEATRTAKLALLVRPPSEARGFALTYKGEEVKRWFETDRSDQEAGPASAHPARRPEPL